LRRRRTADAPLDADFSQPLALLDPMNSFAHVDGFAAAEDEAVDFIAQFG
jgi:hypothetical protein